MGSGGLRVHRVYLPKVKVKRLVRATFCPGWCTVWEYVSYWTRGYGRWDKQRILTPFKNRHTGEDSDKSIIAFWGDS